MSCVSVPAASRPHAALVCGRGSEPPSQPAPQPLLQALAQIQRHVSTLALRLRGSPRRLLVGCLPLTLPSPVAWFLLGFPLGSVTLRSSCQGTASSAKTVRIRPPQAQCSWPTTNLAFGASSALASDWDASGVRLFDSFLSQWSFWAVWGQGIVPPGNGSCRRRCRAICASSLKTP